jgi:hypothetical protein
MTKRQIELHGYRIDIGLDGYPDRPKSSLQPRALVSLQQGGRRHVWPGVRQECIAVVHNLEIL